MNYITYFISQFMFISTLIAVSYFGGPYLRGPFTNVQIKAIILAAFIMVLMFSLMNRLNKRCRPIRFVNKIFYYVSGHYGGFPFDRIINKKGHFLIIKKTPDTNVRRLLLYLFFLLEFLRNKRINHETDKE